MSIFAHRAFCCERFLVVLSFKYMKSSATILAFLASSSLSLAQDQNVPTDPPAKVAPLIEQLSSPDIRKRCEAQALLEEEMKAPDEKVLKQALESLFDSEDPEKNTRLDKGIREAFYSRNFVKELGFLGIEIAKANIRENNQISFVVTVGGLVPGGPASMAGLLEGDLLLSIDGIEIKGPGCEDKMRSKIASKGAGAVCRFKVKRADEILMKEVTLAQRKDFVSARFDFLRNLTEAEKLKKYQEWLSIENSKFSASKAKAIPYVPDFEMDSAPLIEDRQRFFR